MSGTPEPSRSPTGSKPCVLVVDDEPSICAVLVPVLESLGYHTVALADPGNALRLIESAEPRIDVLITDFAMPQMSGLDLIRRGKALQPSLKTILASGEVDQPENVGGPQPDAFLEKPFSTRVLAGLLRSMVGPGV